MARGCGWPGPNGGGAGDAVVAGAGASAVRGWGGEVSGRGCRMHVQVGVLQAERECPWITKDQFQGSS